MRNRLSIILLMFLFALTLSAQGKAKYVFYFIGDGMGVNQPRLISVPCRGVLVFNRFASPLSLIPHLLIHRVQPMG